MKQLTVLRLTALFLLLAVTGQTWSAGDLPTKAPNDNGIASTRHNLTQRWLPGLNEITMLSRRNDYGEVCVYCHTPHGANEEIAAPLWNRTLQSTVYTTYDTVNSATLTGTVTVPGANSLTCLSCHDGTLGIDSIVNMPGSGNYSNGSKTAQDNTFLSTWINPFNFASSHAAMSSGAGSCISCHSPSSGDPTATDFTVFVIGSDLTNDHPVGITGPPVRPDFAVVTGSLPGKMDFYDTDGDGRPDSNEVRFYDTGDGTEVECASCHDPHGVWDSGTLNPSFLRISNAGSQLCFSCHIK